jgi:periplasmic protein CpxP/Spy
MGRMDPAKMQAMADKRHADLKAKLKLTAAQEGAWTTYIAAMKPPASMMANRPDRAEMAKLPTPERIDKMKALHTQHMAEMTAMMDKHGEATKAFYATLTAEQKTVFDTQSMGHHGMDAKRGGPAQPKK